MNSVIKQKIARVLAAAKAATPVQLDPSSPSTSATTADIADRILAGEEVLTLQQVKGITGYAPSTIKRHLRGRPGWLISPGGGIRVAKSLLKQYLTEQASRGLKDAA